MLLGDIDPVVDRWCLYRASVSVGVRVKHYTVDCRVW